MPTLGVVTVGQSPRADLTPELRTVLPSCALVEHGALDGMSHEDIGAMAPKPGEHALTSRLANGESVVFGHDQVLPYLEAAIRRAEDDGADVTLLVCSGSFPDLAYRKPLLYTDKLAHHAVAGLSSSLRVGIIRPLSDQLADAANDWRGTLGRDVAAGDSANPYTEGPEATAAAAERIAGEVDVIVLDCIGYNEPMRRAAARAAGKPVLLVRGLAARLAGEMLVGHPPVPSARSDRPGVKTASLPALWSGHAPGH